MTKTPTLQPTVPVKTPAVAPSTSNVTVEHGLKTPLQLEPLLQAHHL